jgi:hypothetical protein
VYHNEVFLAPSRFEKVRFTNSENSENGKEQDVTQLVALTLLATMILYP